MSQLVDIFFAREIIHETFGGYTPLNGVIEMETNTF